MLFLCKTKEICICHKVNCSINSNYRNLVFTPVIRTEHSRVYIRVSAPELVFINLWTEGLSKETNYKRLLNRNHLRIFNSEVYKIYKAVNILHF